MSGGEGFDWPGLLRQGVRGLGLKPAEFWALTPSELWLMLGPDAGDMPMGRSRLDDLIRAYPDASGTTEGMDDAGI